MNTFKLLCNHDKYVEDHPSLYIIGSSEKNIGKNRYSDIIALDSTIVTLSNGKYINANMIHGEYSPTKFIMTQAPIDNSMDDFYQMIHDYKVNIIVCLTQLSESGVEKATKYWTDEQPIVRGQWIVELTDIKIVDDIVHRKLNIINMVTNESVNVSMIQYTSWIDHNIPDKSSLYKLIGYVSELSSFNPIIVHCSAGVGRSGTFVAAYNAIINDITDIDKSIKWLKSQRTGSVQTESQYNFLTKLVHKN